MGGAKPKEPQAPADDDRARATSSKSAPGRETPSTHSCSECAKGHLPHALGEVVVARLIDETCQHLGFVKSQSDWRG